MPLPLLVIAGLLLTGGLGTGAIIKGAFDNSEANDLNESAGSIFDEAQKRLKEKRELTKRKLDDLGQLKIETWQNQMGSFVNTFALIHDVELNESEVSDVRLPTPEELKEMKDIAASCAEVLSGGVASLGAGALAGFAAYGGATMFAAASTGTAISSLTGVAATNATLAWFGGGSLAAGGLGMTGGVAILGGIVAAPVLLIAGGWFAASSSSKLSKARENIAQAREAASEMDAAGTILDAIFKVSETVEIFLHRLSRSFDSSISDMRSIIKKFGTDFKQYNSQEKGTIYFAVEFANLMKRVLDIPILKKDGDLSDTIYSEIEKIGSTGSKLLGETHTNYSDIEKMGNISNKLLDKTHPNHLFYDIFKDIIDADQIVPLFDKLSEETQIKFNDVTITLNDFEIAAVIFEERAKQEAPRSDTACLDSRYRELDILNASRMRAGATNFKEMSHMLK